jgi:hypothetical protein
MKMTLTLLAAAALLAGCSAEQTTPAPVATVTITATTPSAPPPLAAPTLVPAPVPVVAPTLVTGTVAPPAPQVSGPCSDAELTVDNGTLQSANTQRHVTLTFRNTSSQICTLVGYPGADLVTPAGGVLIHVPRRPANAAHRLTLNPGDVATADVTASAIDTSTGNSCARWGNLVVTPPNGFVSHPLSVDVPICNASISSVD